MELRDTLLLVNDIPRCRAMLQRTFDPNYNLLEAENGAQALVLLEENHRHIAAVLLDTQMPVMDGYEVLSAMASGGFLAELPVIVVTDDPSPQLEGKAFDLGASEIISLSAPEDVLRRRVQNIIALNRRRWQLESLLSPQSRPSTQMCPAAPEQPPSPHQPLTPSPDAFPTQQSLHRELERLQIIMEQSDDIVFEWDIVQDSLTISHKWHNLFGYDPITQHFSQLVSTSSHIHPQDLTYLRQRMKALREGAAYQDTEIRIANSSGRYLWCRLRASLQRDAQGVPVRAVGVIINIDAEKRATRALQDRAEQDSLTRLLNKNTSRAQVEHRLQHRGEQECCALLMFDLDNFKQINDRHGHLFGDTVLTQAAAQLRRFFRREDIIARVGGDEFMVFISNIPDRALVEQRCSGLIGAFSSLFRDTLGEHGLSCSIGVALCPEHGTSFQALFQKADLALYHAKAMGKNRFAFYDSRSQAFPVQNQPSLHLPAQNQPDPGQNQLISRVFQLLHHAGDPVDAIGSILEMAGRQMKVSRVYLYETSPDGSTYTNTFEWCAQGILPTSQMLLQLHFEEVSFGLDDRFDERGVFCCSDVATLPKEQFNQLSSLGVRSLLQFAVTDRGILRGFIGFEQHNIARQWKQELIDTLLTLSQILSVFLLLSRTQHELEQLEEKMQFGNETQT